MGILNRIFGGTQLQPQDIWKTARSPRSDPSHPEHFERYWTKQGVDWTRVTVLRVDKTRVFAIYSDEGVESEELIATRNNHLLAAGYVNTVSTNLNSLDNRPKMRDELNH